MAIDITLRSRASPEAVLFSIQALGGEWRESSIPAFLRQNRVIGVDSTVNGKRYRVALVRRWYWKGERVLHVRGVVGKDEGGGSEVEVHCGIDSPRTDWVVGALLLFLMIFVSSWRDRIIVLLFGAITMVINHYSNGRISRERDPEADYLVRRVEAAVTKASESSEAGSRAAAG